MEIRVSVLNPLLITLQPGGSCGKKGHAINQELFVFVVAGQVTLTLADADGKLSKGDAITIGADRAALLDQQDREARTASICLNVDLVSWTGRLTEMSGKRDSGWNINTLRCEAARAANYRSAAI